MKVSGHARFIISKAESRQPHAVKKTFQQRGHRRPPVGVDDYKVVAPFDSLLQFYKIGLELLNGFVAFVQYRIKIHVADIKTLYLMPSRFGRACIDSGNFARERVLVGMTEQ